MKRTLWLCLILIIFLAGCRNETQNRIRRDLQDYTGGTRYITVYSLDGTPVHRGDVDGQVTRSVSDVVGGAAVETADYVYWFDRSGQYFQTNMPYLMSSKSQEAQGEGAAGE